MRATVVATVAGAALALPGAASAAPKPVPVDQLWSAWSVDPLVWAGAIAGLVFFFQGFARLRRRGRRDLAGWDRAALFTLGLLIVVVGICSPLDAVAESYLQSAHMLQHVLIADLGIALMIVAVRGPLCVFFLPRNVLAPLARSQPLRRTLRWLLRPAVVVPLWLATMIIWHVPALYEGALRHPLVHSFEHLSFVIVGVLLWTLLIDPARHGRLTVNERIGVAAVVFWAGQILAYVIVLSFQPLYGMYANQPVRLFGLSPLTDQKLAGVVMMVEQLLTLGICLLLLLRVARREPKRRHSTAVEKLPA